MKNLIKYLPIILIVGILVVFLIQNIKSKNTTLDDNQIYFFTKKHCPYCEAATEYIKTAYPTLDVKYLDIENKNNYKLFIFVAEKYDIDLQKVGTPLMCMGDNYLLGWSITQQGNFDKYVKKFLKK